MKTDTPQTIYLKDYKPYPYGIKSLDLNFDIHDGRTTVTARAIYQKQENTPLILNGEDLELLSLTIDGKGVTDYAKTETTLTIPAPAQDEFTLEIKTAITPETNTRLEGLYMSGGNYCTQCEAEGFRRITYYPDRPDVLTIMTTRIEADKEKFPILLGNGNFVEKGSAEEQGRHYAIWNDPFPKPCYLFALVAGDLECITDRFKTNSGRAVELNIYVRAGDEGQCDHAMESLKRSMKWDEYIYGREYEHDIFNIVAVSDFNMGAMENTTLNIFNTALVLAQQETATDQDFLRVEGVIAHEYFHNWTGNRVTCRDWFQLSLKEGLTVFRDQEFSADMNSRPVQRIDDVSMLRRMQFPEDAGPLAHPIRPDNYIEINNFYTMTVYEKGAEVIRMFHTLLGAETYRKATDLYFDRYDGMAVTCEDWVQCMEDASGLDLTQFKLWYSQAGTPEVNASWNYDETAKCFTLTLTQHIPSTPGQNDKKPMHIPVRFGLLAKDGTNLIEETILHLKETTQSFPFDNIAEEPTPSILRGFSAPVKLQTNYTNAELSFLALNDTDGFNRWEAGQTMALRMLLSMTEQHKESKEFEICPRYLETYGQLLAQGFDSATDKALLARALSLPDVSFVAQHCTNVDPVAIYTARQALLRAIKVEHRGTLQKLYDNNISSNTFGITPEDMGKRALQNTLLSILSSSKGSNCAVLAKTQYDRANNMTDRVAALNMLADNTRAEREDAFTDFYERFKDKALVIDKWFALQATAVRDTTIEDIRALAQHADFNIKNPNRVRSLYGAFANNNPAIFHAENGTGYDFLTEAIITLNTINPQIAARLLGPMRDWKRYSPDRQEKLKSCLERILKTPDLSPDVFEIASKSLNG